jgi:hypothetical protein
MLENLFRLQIVAQRYEDAAHSVAELRAVRSHGATATPGGRAADVQYEIWARAMARAARGGSSFDAAFTAAFRDIFATLDDRTSTLLIRALSFAPQSLEAALRRAVQLRNGRTEISLTDALSLVRAYQRFETHRTFAPLIAPLINEDDARRYVTERDLQVRTADGATVCALLVRPRAAPGRRLPALLTFTIYVDSAVNVSDARRAASNGYVGVTGFTRGKACSPQTPVDRLDRSPTVERWPSRDVWR